MNRKLLIILGLVALMTPVAIGYIVSRPGNVPMNNDWIGFYGNYAGGIIGGLVAYFIAKYQVDNTIKQQKKEKQMSQIPIYVSVLNELNKVKPTIDTLTTVFSNNNFPEHLTYEQFQMGDYQMPMFNDVNWSGIFNIIDSDFLLGLVEFKDKYIEISKYLGIKLNLLYIERDELLRKIREIEKIKVKNLQQQNEYKILKENHFKVARDVMYIESMKKSYTNELKEFKIQDMLNKLVASIELWLEEEKNHY